MTIQKLSYDLQERFRQQPEDAMGLHAAVSDERHGKTYHLIVGGMVLSTGTNALAGDFASIVDDLGLMSNKETGGLQSRVATFERWFENLKPAPTVDPARLPRDVLGFILTSNGYVPPPPTRPPYVFGHLPFSGTVEAVDVFYRCEPCLDAQAEAVAYPHRPGAPGPARQRSGNPGRSAVRPGRRL